MECFISDGENLVLDAQRGSSILSQSEDLRTGEILLNLGVLEIARAEELRTS